MRFAPKTDKEIEELNLISPGQYSFEVAHAEDAKSKSGNDMIKLKLRIWDNNNHERIIYDYLLEAMAHKLKHFCDCTGLATKYQEGAFSSEDCIGKSGHLELIIQKDRSGQYADKNSVKDYIVKEKKETPTVKFAATNSEDIFGDEIPF